MSTGVLKRSPKNIIVRMPNWLGDFVMATPVIANLKGKWPGVEITAMCQNRVGELIYENPYVDHVIPFKRPNGWIHRSAHRVIIDQLRKGSYDLGILLTNSLSSAWWFWRGHVNHRLGYQGNWRKYLLSEVIPYPKNIEKQHLVQTYQQLLAPLGIERNDRPPKLYLSHQESSQAESLLYKQGIREKHILVGINPGAAYGSAKCWLPERFKALTRKLLDNPLIRVIYFGDPNGASLVNGICSKLPDRVINMAGKTSIRELMALTKQCDLFLTNDSGPMHIAAALDVPLIALFGSTSPIKTGPYSKRSCVICKNVDCSPCYKKVCPIDFRCMEQISVEEVYQEMMKIVNSLNMHSL